MGEQEFDLDVEVGSVILAGMNGEKDLRDSMTKLVEFFDIADNSITPIEVAKQMQMIVIDYNKGLINDQVKEQRIRSVVAKGINAKDILPLSVTETI